jgi:hypothetical protein
VILELLVRVAGALQIALAALHLTFPKRFRWGEELSRLSLLNRQMFLVHTLFLCVVLVLFGSLSLFSPRALLEPTLLARLVLSGIAVFWGLRLVVQWFVYDARLWRGDRSRTLVHLGLSALWAYLTAVYLAALALG